jgi:hypothetical protein
MGGGEPVCKPAAVQEWRASLLDADIKFNADGSFTMK